MHLHTSIMIRKEFMHQIFVISIFARIIGMKITQIEQLEKIIDLHKTKRKVVWKYGRSHNNFKTC